MSDEGRGILGGLFGGEKKEAGQLPRKAVTTPETMIGLCFEHSPGVAYESANLAEAGLEHVLETLGRYGLHATFFCPARLCETAPDKLKRLTEGGHEVGVLGYADESPKELTVDGIRQLIFTCRNAYHKIGLHPIGFRCPHSHWDGRVCEELANQRFRYNAEHDHARRMYVIRTGKHPLIRIPVYTDDRTLLRGDARSQKAMAKHHRLIRKAGNSRRFVSICFHPWILAEEPERMRHWEEWLDAAVKSGAKVGALSEGLPPAESTPEVPDASA